MINVKTELKLLETPKAFRPIWCESRNNRKDSVEAEMDLPLNNGQSAGKLVTFMDNDRIIEKYSRGEISLTRAAKELHISRYKLRKELLNRDIKINSRFKNRKHYFDNRFFENIDTEKKAYWLGFISGDGHVSDYQLTITLNSKDSNHLVLFLDDMKATSHKISFHTRQTAYGTVETATVSLSSVKLVRDLRNIGLESNKSFSLKFPELDSNMIPHFIRGLFDADGTIGLSGGKHKKPYVIFLGNKNMMLSVKSNLDISDNISVLKRYDKKDMFHFRIGSKKDVQHMYQYFYYKSTRHLERKKIKFEKLLGASETIIAQPKT